MKDWFRRLIVGMLFWGGAAQAAILFQPNGCDANEASNWTATATAPNAVLTTNCTFNVEVSSLDAAPPDDDNNWQGFSRQLPGGVTGVTVSHLLEQTTAGLWANLGAARLIYTSGAFGYWDGVAYQYSGLGDRCVIGGSCTLGLQIGSVLKYLINGEVIGQTTVTDSTISEIALMAFNPFEAPLTNNRMALQSSLVPDSITVQFSGLQATGPDRNQVPEPASLLLALLAMVGLTLTSRQKQRALAHRR